MDVRERTILQHRAVLSPYACDDERLTGRARPMEPCPLRTDFQRDRDRIIHCKAFRRLKHKTQVFLQPEGDHYRTRMTHTLEVSRIARTIARALSLNEDLTEAIALGHDLGHTPFGHAGEKALDEIHPGGFAHYRQSIRVVQVLEKNGEGLNLTWEVIDGIRNHKTSGRPSTLEGQIVRLSDKIAYINHDIDDAIRGGILREKDIPKKYTDVLGTSVKGRLNTLVHNVIINSVDRPVIQMSEEVHEAMQGLRVFMFENVYRNPVAKKEEGKAIHMITNLYEFYIKNPEFLPEQSQNMLKKGEELSQVVCDYIAGMTDTYAVKKFTEFFIPESWKN